MSTKSPKAKAAKATAPAHTVPVLRKALRVLRAVAESPGDGNAKSLAASLRISESTCYRILQTFVAEDWLRPTGNGGFALSFGLHPLLQQFHPMDLLARAAEAPLRELSAVTGLTAKLVVRQGNEALTLHSVTPNRPMAVVPKSGARVTLAMGSSGAVLLAGDSDRDIEALIAAVPPDTWRHQGPKHLRQRLVEARDRGVCRDTGSYDPHLHTLSLRVPANPRVPALALTLLGFPGDFTPTSLPALHAAMHEAARMLAHNLNTPSDRP